MAKQNTTKKKDDPPDQKESGDGDKIPSVTRSAVKTRSRTQTTLQFSKTSADAPLTQEPDAEREEREEKKLGEKALKKISEKKKKP